MQSYGMTLMVKDDEAIVERYKAYHRKAWPEVVSRLRENGITEMRIYLLGRRMFMYMEAVDGFSPERDFAKLAQDARYRGWDERTPPWQQRAQEPRAHEGWAPMEEVFDLSAR